MGYLSKGDRITQSEHDIIDTIGALGTPLYVLRINAAGDDVEWAAAGAGTGDVTKVGTPVNNQIGVWTGDGTIEGDSALTFDTTTDVLSSGGFLGTGLTASELIGTDGSKNLVSLAVATYPSLTELTYVKGVTSAIQTQLGTKAGTALSNLASVAINTTLVSDTDNTDALGTSAIAWSDLFLGSGAVITFNSAPSTADITITHSADTLTFAGGTIALGTATATGGLTGNVTGNVSGSAATVTTAAQPAITSLGTLTALVVDNISIDLNTISTSSGNLNITPVAGSNITLDGTITIDAGVVAGMTSLTMSGNVIMGTNSITMTGSIAATGARVTKGWFTDIESTNMPTVGGTAILTSLTAPQFTTIELGHATDTTLSRVSAGVVAIEGVNILTTAGGTLTGNIVLGENTSIDFDPAGSADGKYSGFCITGTAGAALTFGQLIYLAVADSRWELCDADATATAGTPLIGMCVLAAAGDGSATKILLQGTIRADAQFPALTIGAPAYVGETAGAIQTAIPTGADSVIRVVGRALTADELYFCPSQDHQITVA